MTSSSSSLCSLLIISWLRRSCFLFLSLSSSVYPFVYKPAFFCLFIYALILSILIFSSSYFFLLIYSSSFLWRSSSASCYFLSLYCYSSNFCCYSCFFLASKAAADNFGYFFPFFPFVSYFGSGFTYSETPYSLSWANLAASSYFFFFSLSFLSCPLDSPLVDGSSFSSCSYSLLTGFSSSLLILIVEY